MSKKCTASPCVRRMPFNGNHVSLPQISIYVCFEECFIYSVFPVYLQDQMFFWKQLPYSLVKSFLSCSSGALLCPAPLKPSLIQMLMCGVWQGTGISILRIDWKRPFLFACLYFINSLKGRMGCFVNGFRSWDPAGSWLLWHFHYPSPFSKVERLLLTPAQQEWCPELPYMFTIL